MDRDYLGERILLQPRRVLPRRGLDQLQLFCACVVDVDANVNINVNINVNSVNINAGVEAAVRTFASRVVGNSAQIGTRIMGCD